MLYLGDFLLVVHIMYHILLSTQVLTGNNLTDCIICNKIC